jgi:phosphoribosylformylglycinamidine synthase
MDSVAYPALELAAKGFEPLALTDCLNFGNPEKPELMTEFVAAVEGMSQTCAALRVPVISGNVSFYNETLDQNVTSTPTTGLVGLRPNLQSIPASHFTGKLEGLFLLRLPQVQLSGQLAELKTGSPMVGQGEVHAHAVAGLVRLLTHVARQPYVRSTRVVGKFGLAYALARMCIPLEIGARTAAGDWFVNVREPARSLFGENLYEVLVAVERSHETALRELIKSFEVDGLKIFKLGETGGDRIVAGRALDIPVSEAKRAYQTGWEAHFEGLE